LRLLIITARGNRFYTTQKKESKYGKIVELAEHLRCHEVKELTPSSRTGASLAAVLCTEVLDEVSSSACFLFLSAPVSSERVGGGDVDKLVSSFDSSASSPS
jgi:hypothetical protein